MPDQLLCSAGDILAYRFKYVKLEHLTKPCEDAILLTILTILLAKEIFIKLTANIKNTGSSANDGSSNGSTRCNQRSNDTQLTNHTSGNTASGCTLNGAQNLLRKRILILRHIGSVDLARDFIIEITEDGTRSGTILISFTEDCLLDSLII